MLLTSVEVRPRIHRPRKLKSRQLSSLPSFFHHVVHLATSFNYHLGSGPFRVFSAFASLSMIHVAPGETPPEDAQGGHEPESMVGGCVLLAVGAVFVARAFWVH